MTALPRSRLTHCSAEFLRYFLASLLALATDLALFSLCLRVLHWPLHVSAALAFITGAFTAYVLSVRWVFRRRTMANWPVVELSTFIGIGLCGLGLTQAVLWLGVTQLGLWPEAVKLVAAGLSFLCNYALRKWLLFARRDGQVVLRGDAV